MCNLTDCLCGRWLSSCPSLVVVVAFVRGRFPKYRIVSHGNHWQTTVISQSRSVISSLLLSAISLAKSSTWTNQKHLIGSCRRGMWCLIPVLHEKSIRTYVHMSHSGSQFCEMHYRPRKSGSRSYRCRCGCHGRLGK